MIEVASVRIFVGALAIGVLVAKAGSAQESRVIYNRVSIENAIPRKDVQGNIVDAHDGCLRFFGGKYYLYGTSYGNTDGQGKTNRYVVYSSPNLMEWTNEGVLLGNARPAIYTRPYVVFNARTRKYVLWFSVDGRMGAAVADKPTGPFSLVNDKVSLSHRTSGDLGLFVDDDGTAFVTYTYADAEEGLSEAEIDKVEAISTEPIPNFRIVVEELTPDYLAVTGRISESLGGNTEAPALFRRGKYYYLLFDNTCAYCSAGTGVRVYTAQRPLGPFVYTGNVNRVGPTKGTLPSPWTSPGTGRPDAIIKAQQTDIAVLPGASDKVYLWLGDRWHSAPDGIKGHDFQNWAVLSFDSKGIVQQLENRDEWTFEVATGTR